MRQENKQKRYLMHFKRTYNQDPIQSSTYKKFIRKNKRTPQQKHLLPDSKH
ncbi:hypothetical protein DPMN_051901 [Dreissena polymorpha]|uniref:Uncharacterized protein n=1 Tax=Dreissena polymorpha TaxID=45954 RepID=A0A9D4CJU8_DREPO|nr:hypothetical protein DPMN_051901 [Dreissena polymorpha]